MHNNYTIRKIKFLESCGDLIGKSAAPRDWNMVVINEIVTAREDESDIFTSLEKKLKEIILEPNDRDNCLTMNGEGHVLSLNHRSNLTILGDMVKKCGNYLKSLYLQSCKLAELPDITALWQLEHLYVDNNRLVKIPESIGYSESLKTLSFTGNSVEAFPCSIVLLKNLEEILFDNNLITEIPVTIGQLKHLKTFSSSKNNITKPKIPKHIHKSEQMLKYIQELYSAGSRIVNRCKIMLVGDGGVGKSSLVKSLIRWTRDKENAKKKKNNCIDEPNVATDGIELTSIFIEPEKKYLTQKLLELGIPLLYMIHMMTPLD